jgi:Rrf2 family protein
MKLPAKVYYGCKAVLELALRYDNRQPVRLATISGQQNIPTNFLVQLLIRLKNAGIVESTRGASGGYTLAKPPGEISLADVFKAVDDNILGKHPVTRRVPVQTGDALIAQFWQELNVTMNQRLEATTFESLAMQAKSSRATYTI